MSQLQEPYSSVGYLCARTPFLSVLKLRHPSLMDNKPHQRNEGSENLSWTAWDVCEGKSISLNDRCVVFEISHDTQTRMFLIMANTMMFYLIANPLSCALFHLSLAWAERRGYKTAKAARNDVYRAANSLLRLAIDGRLCLCLRPPGYSCLSGKRSFSMTHCLLV